MAKYVALFRALNVGGNNMIKMDVLRSLCEAAGLKNVKTFLVAGNVIFDSNSKNPALIASKIEKHLLALTKTELKVIVLPLEDLMKIAKVDPFKKTDPTDAMLCVIFFASTPANTPKLPLTSTTECFEVLGIGDRVAFVVARRKPTGWFGFPNGFIEKQLGVVATTRQWSTVKKFVAFAEKG
jgi:uncharacterized protein (DUF1697 family)